MISQAVTDAHVHLWQPEKLRYDWLEGLPSLNRPCLPGDFPNATRVGKWVVVEAACSPGQAVAEVDWICELAASEPRIRGIVAAAPLELGAAVTGHLAELARRPLVRGVRRILQGEDDDIFLTVEFVTGVRLLAVHQFSFDLCIRHDQLEAVTELARAVPETLLVLDHCAKPPIASGELGEWKRHLRGFARLPNTFCKISGLATEAGPGGWIVADLRPVVEEALDAFGPSRLLFGGDWPVASLATDYQRWLEAVDELTGSLDPSQKQSLFSQNADRIYRL